MIGITCLDNNRCCGQLGKRANCQSLVSLTLAASEVPVLVGLRLFLPDEWTADLGRCARAGVPEAEVVARAKGEIALAELDRVAAAGVRFGCVLADAGYGISAAFRHALDERGLLWAVGTARDQKVYGTDVRLVPPTGRPRKPVPDQEPQAAEDVLAAPPWRRVTWREATKGRLAARFAAKRIRVADGPVWGSWAAKRTNHHLPGKEAWLVGEWRASGERKYDLANLPARTSARALAAAIKARWVCEQAYQQLKGELSLPLRGPFLDRGAPPRPDGPYRLCLSATPAPRRAKPDGAGGKCAPAFRDRHHHQACPQCAGPSHNGCSPSTPSSVHAANTGSSHLLN